MIYVLGTGNSFTCCCNTRSLASHALTLSFKLKDLFLPDVCSLLSLATMATSNSSKVLSRLSCRVLILRRSCTTLAKQIYGMDIAKQIIERELLLFGYMRNDKTGQAIIYYIMLEEFLHVSSEYSSI